MWSERRASLPLQRLVRLLDLLDSMRNQFFAPIGLLLLWNEHLAFAFDRWRGGYGREIRRVRAEIGEMEALLSLATFAYEHPDDVFPTVSGDGEPHFVASGLAHPLLPSDQGVRNDVSIGAGSQLWILSGSNMSGKSTLLRAIASNLVLAYAGGTVRASSLRAAHMRIGASIRVLDSLQEGSSRFYAEIQKIKLILDEAATGEPLLFVLDEIFHGTNSHDRLIGAEAVLSRLVQLGAIGIVTTHDLALARLEEKFPDRARNVHLEDHIEHGVMTFDYQLKPGVVKKSNAIELMRSVGLDV
jgi:DNA mismatch repair ATPase MutS